MAKFVIKCRPVAISFILGNFDNIFPLKCCHSEPLFENLPTFSSPETTFDEFRHLFVGIFAKNPSFRQQVSQRQQTFYPIGVHTLQSQLFSTPFAGLHIPKEPARLSPTGSSFNRYLLHYPCLQTDYSMISVTTPEPTVLPPSLIANLSPSSIAIGVISSISIVILSPGIHISTPSGNFKSPVTSVVLK